MNANADLAGVRQIVVSRLAPLQARVYLFGSRASGSAHLSSDIDVAVLPRSPLPAGLLAEVREALDDSLIPLHVDLVDLSETDSHFREAVLREGVPWAG